MGNFVRDDSSAPGLGAANINTGIATGLTTTTVGSNKALDVNVVQTVGGGGSGGAVTIVDGGDVTLGSKTDPKSTATDATSTSAISILKQISASVQVPPSQAVTFTGSTDVATQTTLNTVKNNDLKNILGLTSLAIKSAQFSLIKKTVLPTPSTVSGNPHMAFDGVNTIYVYSPANVHSQIYSYNILTDTLTALTNGTTLDDAYAGATIIYANSKLYFTRGGGFTTFYSLTTDGLTFTTLTGTTNGTNFGCALVWDGSNYIYLRNTTPALERYSISGNTWSSMTAPASAGAEGQSMTFAGTDRIYSLQGGGTTGFSVYSVSGNSWTAKTATPGNIYDGGSLAWNGDNYIYAFQGNGATTMYRYDILANIWDTLLIMPILSSTGSGMIAMSNGSFLCYLTDPSGITAYGVVNNLYVFDPTNNSVLRGRYNSTQPTNASGQQGEIQISADGSIVTALDSTTEAAADGISNTIRVNKDAFGFTPVHKSFNWIYNSTANQWERVRTISTGIQGVGITDGTNTMNVLKSDGTAAGQNSQFIAGAYLEKASLSTVSTSNNDLLASLDVNNYKWMSLAVTGTWTGTVTVQGSNDNFSTQTYTLQGYDIPNQGKVQTFTGNSLYMFPVQTRYIRVRVTTGGTGTVTGTAELYTTPPPAFSVIAAQSGTFAVSLAAETTKVIGTVNVAAAQTIGITANSSVNVAQINGVTPLMGAGNTGTGSQRVTIASDQAVLPISDNSGSLTVDYATTGSGTATGALRVELPTNGTGVVGLNSGTNNVGQVSVAPQTANGLSVFNASSSDGATALTNTAQAIKASAGQVYGWYIYNPNSTAQFVQFYNTAQASVTVGTTNPLFMLTIPATSAANVEFTNGITFSNAGFSCSATSTAGGNGAPTTALDAIIFYK